MSPDLKQTLLLFASTLLGPVIFLIFCRVKKLSPRRDLDLVWPAPRVVAGWVLAFALLVALEELLWSLVGSEAPTPMRGPFLLVALRFLAMVLLAPLSEELLFRGMFFYQVSRRLGPMRALVLAGALFALLHLQYGPLGMGVIFVDGLFFGLARYRARSLWLPILLHSLGNLYAAIERLLA
jgi:membrane protease YdiL (CAAX protease family)